MDYTTLTSAHTRHGADVTISCVDVPASQSREFGIVEVDENQRLKGFIEKPDRPAGRLDDGSYVLASMGIYLFSADYLLSCLDADARDRESRHDFGYSIVPRIVGDANVYVSLFRTRDGNPGYWRDVGAVDSYWLAHRELLDSGKRGGIDRSWPLHGAPRGLAPARVTATATVKGSVLGAECVIAGTVEASVVSTGCQVGEATVVTESVLLPGVKIGRNCMLNRVIVDSGCRVPDDTVLDTRYLDSGDEIYVSPNGVALVTADALAYAAVQPSLRTA
jgi:glucose-1-phosphate adenylyltransferase